MSTTKTPLSQIISLSDLPWQERQPGVRGKSIWEHAESKRRAVMTRIAHHHGHHHPTLAGSAWDRLA